MPGNIKNVMAAIDYIESRLHEKLDLETVAGAVHYSKYHLHRMFTGTVGLTIHDYVQRRQLTEAAKLLVLSDKPILEIALSAGYESQQSLRAAISSSPPSTMAAKICADSSEPSDSFLIKPSSTPSSIAF